MSIYKIGLNVLLCCVGAAAVSVSISLADSAALAQEQLRDSRVQLQRMQQSIKLLENTEYQDMIVSLDSDSNNLKLSVAEFLSDNHINDGVFDVSYELSLLEKTLLPQSSFPIMSYRLGVSFRVVSAKALATYLHSAKMAVYPWPVEVRACDIHRMVANQLLANCVLDIHYWSMYD